MGAFAVGVALMLGFWSLRRTAPAAENRPERKERQEKPDARDLAMQADAKLREGQIADAEALLDRAERADAALDLVPLTRGRIAMTRRDYALGRRMFESALKLKESEEAHGDLADALFHTKEYAGAVEEATKGKRLFTRAAAYAALERNEEALRDYAAYTAEHPDDAGGWLNRGNHEMRMGLKERAIASWRKAIERDASLKDELEELIRKAG